MNPRRQAEILRDLLNGNVVKPAVSQEFYLNVAFPQSAPPVQRSEGAEEGARVPVVVNTPGVNDPEESGERGRRAWGRESVDPIANHDELLAWPGSHLPSQEVVSRIRYGDDVIGVAETQALQPPVDGIAERCAQLRGLRGIVGPRISKLRRPRHPGHPLDDQAGQMGGERRRGRVQQVNSTTATVDVPARPGGWRDEPLVLVADPEQG